MRSSFRLFLAASLVGLAGVAGLAHGQQPASPANPAASSAAYPAGCPPLLRQSYDRLQDEKPQSLCQYAGKVLLVVNTASFCGFTRQYEGLEALDRKYRAKGLVVLGFPSNDFSQESGSNKEVADFCENTFGVKFPMFVKSSVRGRDANPLFQALARQTGTTPKWNFYKYMVGRDGKVVAAYSSLTEPDDRDLLATLQKQLAANPQ
ncbi:glutathione peroxidase [Variovorax sp. OV329]|uniref:glutathione peroxidase n=1 Tax=Variovorax sp. OV329 TaxID=1882825 RepID=UPI0008E60905|nr:glutathione peroxidase [Variovorax sp. OV329]SFM32060.1 glutathione peroxidase [Variovorax sp. OV329]